MLSGDVCIISYFLVLEQSASFNHLCFRVNCNRRITTAALLGRAGLGEPHLIMLTFLFFLCSLTESGMVNNRTSESTTAVTSNTSPPKACAGCGGKIADRFLLYSMDRYWHTRCLKCSCCQAQLGEIGTSCYTKSGMILCRNDYIR